VVNKQQKGQPLLAVDGSMAAQPVVLAGNRVAVKPAMPPHHRGLRLRIWIYCPFRATGQSPPPPYQHRRTAAMSASVWLRRKIVGSPGHCVVGAVRPPHRQSTMSPGGNAIGLRPFPAPPSYRRHRTAALSASEWLRKKYVTGQGQPAQAQPTQEPAAPVWITYQRREPRPSG